jgi:hypothetical protein
MPEVTARAKKIQQAEVLPIYRPGDRLIVELMFVYYEVTVQRCEMRAGSPWLYGVGEGFALAFPAERVRGRLAPGESAGWTDAA